MLKVKKNHRNIYRPLMDLGMLMIVLLASLSVTQAKSNQTKGKPNIILFLTDDQGWTDTSVQMMEGRPDSKSNYYQTPQLERLAQLCSYSLR